MRTKTPAPTNAHAEQQRHQLAVASRRHDTAPAGNSVLIAAELGVMRCRWCNDDLDHCHESFVVHAIGETHCMGANCSTPAELHHMVVDCTDFGCTCAESAAARAGQEAV
jgi:hypothetical protein